MTLSAKHRNEIDGIRRRFGGELDDARSDPGLSGTGKDAKITELFEAARDRIDAIKATSAEAAQERRAGLERRLFGIVRASDAASVISFRDAVDRVATVKRPEELAALMQRASVTGDDALERAGLRLAVERAARSVVNVEGGYGALVDEYVAQHPGQVDAVREYQQLTAASAPGASFEARVATSLPTPPEVKRHRASRPAPVDSLGGWMTR